MNFTKQDITKLAQKLAEVSVKDTQFKTVGSVKEVDKIPILDTSGKNKVVSLADIVKDIISKIDLTKIEVNVEGAEADNLAALLSELYRLAKEGGGGGGGGGGGDGVGASEVGYSNPNLVSVTSVEGALNAILELINRLQAGESSVPVVNYVLDNMLGTSVMEADMPASVYYPNAKNIPAKYKGKVVRFDRVLNQDTDNYDIVETICDPDVCAIYFNGADESFYRYVGGAAPWSKISTSSSTPPPTAPTGFTLLVGDDSVIISAAPGSSSFTVTDDEIIIQQ